MKRSHFCKSGKINKEVLSVLIKIFDPKTGKSGTGQVVLSFVCPCNLLDLDMMHCPGIATVPTYNSIKAMRVTQNFTGTMPLHYRYSLDL